MFAEIKKQMEVIAFLEDINFFKSISNVFSYV